MSLTHDLEDTLRDLGHPARAVQEKRYLKSEREHFGTTVPLIRKTVRQALRAVGDLDGDGIQSAFEMTGRLAPDGQVVGGQLQVTRELE